MKTLLILCASVLLTNWTLGQTIDGTGSKRLISKGHVTIETNKLHLSSNEEEISGLESKECEALLKRDTAALKDLWLKDFTLDEPQNEIHNSKNPIPYYLSLHRTIEKFTLIDNVIYTTGVEYMIRVKSDGKIEEQIKRKFTHMWTRKLFTWKISSKTYE